ncbi:hypothetical protein [Roseovarius sp.]|jgi:hypothetical protein
MMTREIEVDFDIHKLIETNRLGFEESANDVLRRLLGLEEQTKVKTPSSDGVTTKYWRKGAVALPSGTKLRMEHNGENYFAEIVNGDWIDEFGEKHKSASGAANALARKNSQTTLNGKIYWYINLPGKNTWIRYDEYENNSIREHALKIDV